MKVVIDCSSCYCSCCSKAALHRCRSISDLILRMILVNAIQCCSPYHCRSPSIRRFLNPSFFLIPYLVVTASTYNRSTKHTRMQASECLRCLITCTFGAFQQILESCASARQRSSVKEIFCLQTLNSYSSLVS